MLHPPPIPARRNATSSAPPPQTGSTSQAGLTATTTCHTENVTLKSQSAPSSPTEKEEASLDDTTAREGLKSASPNRPRSMAVTQEGSIQYTTIKFADGVNHHPPPARRNTAYSDIKHPSNQPIREDESPELTSPTGDVRPVSPSYVSMGVCHVQLPAGDTAESVDQTEEPAYDVPPPPVPVRFGSQDGCNPPQEGSDATTSPCSQPTPVARDTSKKSPDDPFSRDPFYDTSWNDPSAFYDTPRSVLSNAHPEPPQEDCYIEIGGVTTITAAAATAAVSTTADFTGDSSYEDTSSFLQDIRARYKSSHPGEVLSIPQPAQQGPSDQPVVDDEAFAMYDLPPVEEKVATAHIPAKTDENVQLGSYDFPAALNRFPFREGEGGGAGGGAGEDVREKSRDEPPLHTFQYPMQRMPFQHSASEGANATSAHSSTAGVVRSESISRGSRANVPLPPTPVEQNTRGLEASGREDPPPLPARQGGALPLKPVPLRDVPGAIKPVPLRDIPGAMPPLKPVPLRDVPAAAAVPHKPIPARDGPLPPVPNANERPLLPPMNHPWGNRKPLSSAQDNPPLPPRNKAAGSTNGHPDATTGGTAAIPQQEDPAPAMLDLMSKGYQRADIESALRIARDDYELAKSILKEFGGRH